MKYMPVLRYRDSEKKILDAVPISQKILPMLEIIQEKRKTNMISTCYEEIGSYLKNSNTSLLIDFPMYLKIQSNTKPGVSNFIQPMIANPKLRIDNFKKLNGLNIIPVVSYNPHTPIFPSGNVSFEITELRKLFSRIAIRIFTPHAQLVLNESKGLLQKDDIIIIDIDEDSHNNPIFNNYFSTINTFAKKHGCKTILLRTVIGPDITYTGLTNNSVITKLDNSHLTDYQKYGFDAFGDYCGLKKDKLTNGGKASPGCFFYHWWTNSYYGHKGVFEKIDTFTSLVTPSLVSSKEWHDYSTNSPSHHPNCPGCNNITQIFVTKLLGNSASKWKYLIGSHYLYTMEEFL